MTLRFSHAFSPEGVGIASAIHRLIMTKVPELQELSLELDKTRLAGVFSFQAKQRYNIRISKLHLRVISLLSRLPRYRATPLISNDLFNELSAYINSMATSLTELDVNGVALEFTQFKDVVNLFKFPTNVLTALHLPIDKLCPQVFIFMSHALPRLQRFTVRYRTFDGRELPNPFATTPLVDPQANFIAGMQAQNFAHWNLGHLHIVSLRGRRPAWVHCAEAIADAFPNVKTFGGTSRENYVSCSSNAIDG
ncbi:hypothetical protein H1R20_g471, partial [Candolleomyces eurysporus]